MAIELPQRQAKSVPLRKLLLPTAFGLAGALYSYLLRRHPWEAALVVGLAAATLTYGAMRSSARLRSVYRRAQAPWERK